MQFPKKLLKQLEERKNTNSLRTLSVVSSQKIDFSSNDYLGLSKTKIECKNKPIGSTGSRLITGNYTQIEAVEKQIALFHGKEEGLIFNSGYTANLGLFSTLPQRNDVILYDEYIHASIRDGIRLSNASSYHFKHNAIDDLEKKIIKYRGNTIYVAVESVYSMHGDSPSLQAFAEICQKYNAYLIVDEAHGVGIVGKKGEGLVSVLNLQSLVFATVITFGKAVGCHGAIVLGSKSLKDYLINFCRSFIYTTAPAPSDIQILEQQYIQLQNKHSARMAIRELKQVFLKHLNKHISFVTGDYGAIVAIVIGGNTKTKQVAGLLQQKNMDVRAILSPTVPKGKECIRICLHSFNTTKEIVYLASQINEILPTINEE